MQANTTYNVTLVKKHEQVAQEPNSAQFALYTDKPSYAIGERAIVIGNIGNRTAGDTVQIDVYDPEAIFKPIYKLRSPGSEH